MRRFLVPSGGLLKPCGVTERHEMILVTGVDLNPRSALIPRKLLILRYAKTAQLAETAILFYTFLTLPVLERGYRTVLSYVAAILAFSRSCSGSLSFTPGNNVDSIRTCCALKTSAWRLLSADLYGWL